MKARRELTDKEILEVRIEAALTEAYLPVAHMNRAARRTKEGRAKMLEAQRNFLLAKRTLLQEHLEGQAC